VAAQKKTEEEERKAEKARKDAKATKSEDAMGKRDEQERKADAARKEAEERKAAEVASKKKAEEEQRVAEEAKKAEQAQRIADEAKKKTQTTDTTRASAAAQKKEAELTKKLEEWDVAEVIQPLRKLGARGLLDLQLFDKEDMDKICSEGGLTHVQCKRLKKNIENLEDISNGWQTTAIITALVVCASAFVVQIRNHGLSSVLQGSQFGRRGSFRSRQVEEALISIIPEKEDDAIERKFVATKLIFGKASTSAGGLVAALGVKDEELRGSSIDAIKAEWDKSGTDEDKGNFQYVAYGTACDHANFPEHMKKQVSTGFYHGGRLEDPQLDIDFGNNAMKLEDFAKCPAARIAKLTTVEVLCIRLYTTSSFGCFNKPLRTSQKPHPFARSVFHLYEGLKKLRAVEATRDPEGFIKEVMLYRGMKNMKLDEGKFKKQGGTELAPMSTTADIQVAAKYAYSESPLVFEYKTLGNSRGVCIKDFSVYPKEAEYLYPPLTLIVPQGDSRKVGRVTLLTVAPQMS